jgi:1-deoxy-D-xylulose-5-phosphate reductoisomerase
MKGVCILGATGSIGQSTLAVLSKHPQQFRVVALTAHTQVTPMLTLCQEYHPEYAVMADEKAAERLQQALRSMSLEIQVLSGQKGLETVASLPQSDVVMAAIVGSAGLRSSMAAAKAGKRLLLANKESLVMAGHLLLDAVSQNQATLLPVDSEHNAIFQCLPENGAWHDGSVSKVLLTASGGPFRSWTTEQLQYVTPEQACAHPNWSMGRKISVDSASLMNKGLEVIEACWLFDLPVEQIEVVVHPQSIIHSMVQYVDGSTLAQMGNPDMRTPIAYALSWPSRIAAGVSPLNLIEVSQMTFEKPDVNRFPCLRLAMDSMRAGGCAPIYLNAANEVAVAAFLDEKIPFMGIPQVIESTLNDSESTAPKDIKTVLLADQRARDLATEIIGVKQWAN